MLRRNLYPSCLFLLAMMSVMILSCETNQHAKDSKNQQKSENNQVAGKVPVKIELGSIYTVDKGRGKFGVVKILAIDEHVVHLKVYQNEYNSRPDSFDIKDLVMGNIEDKGRHGIDHLPFGRTAFENWKPVFVAHEGITEKELQTYKAWKPK